MIHSIVIDDVGVNKERNNSRQDYRFIASDIGTEKEKISISEHRGRKFSGDTKHNRTWELQEENTVQNKQRNQQSHDTKTLRVPKKRKNEKNNELNVKRKDDSDSDLKEGDDGMSIGGTSHKICMTLDSSESPPFQKSFLDSLPFPFSLLDLRKASSCTGKCWLFHMSDLGFFQGYLFPGGYRLYGLKKNESNVGTFFMECRNYKKNIRGVLSALIEKTDTVGNKCATLTLTNGVVLSSVPKTYMMNYHSWKEGMSFCEFKLEEKNEPTIDKYFHIGQEIFLEDVEFIYLNELFTDNNPDHFDPETPIQSNLFQPDTWCPFDFKRDYIFKPIKINDMKLRPEVQINNTPRKIRKLFTACPKKRSNFSFGSKVYVVNRKKLNLKRQEKWMVIPYSFDKDKVSFVRLHKKQYDTFLKDYKEDGSYRLKEYQDKLQEYMKQNDHDIIDTFYVNGTKCKNGCVVGISDNYYDNPYVSWIK